MGYSIYTHARSNKEYKEMLAFLEKNFRPWTKLYPKQKNNFVTNPLGESEYPYRRNQIGFGYNSCVLTEREYAFMLCRWIALKVGKLRKFRKLGNKKYPYILYDNYDYWPVLKKEDKPPKEWKWCVVNSVGFKFSEAVNLKERLILTKTNPWFLGLNASQKRSWISFLKKQSIQFREEEILVRNELKRLDKLWKAKLK